MKVSKIEIISIKLLSYLLILDHFSHEDIKFKVESKADDSYKCVSAASIVAKVHRDRMLKDWEFVEPGMDSKEDKIFGWGYPGDEVTKTWLDNHYDRVFGFPTIVRFSWSTWDKRINWFDEDNNSKNLISCIFPKQTNYETLKNNVIKKLEKEGEIKK